MIHFSAKQRLSFVFHSPSSRPAELVFLFIVLSFRSPQGQYHPAAALSLECNVGQGSENGEVCYQLAGVRNEVLLRETDNGV